MAERKRSARKKVVKKTTEKKPERKVAPSESVVETAVASMPETFKQSEPPAKPKPVQRATAKETKTSGRDRVCEAMFSELLERGISEREALAHVEQVADRMRLDGEEGSAPEIGFYDLRAEQDYIYPPPKNPVLKRANAPVFRAAHEIDTLVIHQAAIEFGVGKWAIRKSGGDVELARARRALDVACHVMVFRQRYFVAAHPLTVYVNHANRLNGRSIGMEIDGRYSGLLDDPDTAAREDLRTTWKGKPTELTEDTIETAKRACKWTVDEAKREGATLKYVMAHRQVNDNRRSDPGEGIWKSIVLDYVVSELGLEPQRGSQWREGRPIPKAWDPKGDGPY